MAKQLTYILLGDGDFTYSLDMCRYLAALSDHHSSLPCAPPTTSGDDSKTAISSNTTHHDVTCTGVDTSEEVKRKYKDADFVLTNIQSINKRADNIEHQQSSESRLTTKIVHGINAVQPTLDDDHPSLQHFDHVLFHHPHLGIEDAQLHKRFLLHFFHAATKRWMKPNGGLLYLTLVIGQCERWMCISGAERHGLVLLRRGKFCPPPSLLSKEKTYYQLRRHQSGKSFASRRAIDATRDGESETLVFGRSCDYPSTTSSSSLDDNVGMLPWESTEATTFIHNKSTEKGREVNNVQDVGSTSISADPYPCNYCTKSFHEERSLKNHIICSHPDCNEAIAWAQSKKMKKGKKRKMNGKQCIPEDEQQPQQLMRNGGERFICKICDSEKKEDEPSRVFPHKQALLDHERAKHSGVHLNIKPDWYKGTGGEESCDVAPPSVVSSCPICDLVFSSDADRIRHEQDFVPTAASTVDSTHEEGASQSSSFQCSHCPKSFREERAKRQHENFWSAAVAAATT